MKIGQYEWRKEDKIESVKSMKHSQTIDDITLLFCEFSSEGKILAANDSFLKFFNKSAENTTQTNIPFPLDDLLTQKSVNSKNFHYQFLYNKNGDGPKSTEWIITAITDEQNNVVKYQAAGHHINSNSDDELADVLSAVEQSTAIVVITDLDGNVKYINPQFTATTGYTFEEVRGKGTRLLKSGYHNETFYSKLWNTVKAGNEWSGEFCNKKKNGELYWESATISPVRDKKGKITHFMAVKEDITERKNSENLQQAVYKISQSVNTTQNLDELYAAIHKILGEVLPVQNFFISLYDKQNDLISFPYFVDQYDEPYQTEKPGRGLTEYVLRTGKPLLVDQKVFKDLILRGEVDLYGTDSLDWLGVPLKINDETIGVIVVQSYDENIRLRKQDYDILCYVSDQIALAIQRAKTIKLLQDSQARYQLLFDKAADLIVIVDKLGNILDVNSKIEDESGWKKDELIGENVLKNGLLTNRSTITTAFYLSKIILGKEVPIFEIEGIAKDGHIIPYELKAVPIKEHGNIIGVQAILRNISDRKGTEAKLKSSERRLSNLMANLPGMAYRCKNDANWTMEFISQGCYELTGYYPQELINNAVISYNNLIHPDDVERVSSSIRNAVSKNLPFQITYRIISKSGEERWVWEKGSTITSKSKEIEALEGFITDITTRVKAEDALKESEELYRKLIATLPDIIAITDLTGNIIFLNEVGIRFSGFSNFEEVKRKNILYFIDDEDRERVKENFKVAIEKNIGAQEYRFKSKTGEKYFFEVQREVLRNAEGQPYGLIFSCRDITFRKQAEDALLQSEEKYRTLIDSIQDGVFLIQDGVIKFSNQSLASMLGRSLNEITDKPYIDFIADEDKELVNTNYYKRKSGEFAPSSYEFRMKHKENRNVYVNLSARVIEYKGSSVTIGTLKDITQQKILQETLLAQKELFRGVAEATNVLLTNSDFKEAIQKTLTVLGKTSDVDRVYIFENVYSKNESYPVMNQRFEWTNGKVSSELQNPELQNLNYLPVFENWYNILSSREVVATLTKDLNDDLKNFLEEEKIKSIILVPIFVENLFWGFVGFDECKYERQWNESEISILKATAASLGGAIQRETTKKELISAKETAEEMNKIKSNFLANMSHELRTPLIAILGYSEILMNEIKNNDSKEMIETIMMSGKRLLETLNLILDLSKVEADKVSIKFEKLNILNEIREVVTLLSPIAQKKELYLNIEIKNINVSAKLDKRIFHSVLSNLIGNAIKYTHHGGIVVELNSINSGGAEFAEIKVRDTGIGIAEEDQHIIFDEFRQVSEGYNRHFEGAGLGLTITKKFVEKMKGSISVKSKMGVGTEFSVIFPIGDPMEILINPVFENNEPVMDAASGQELKRVLIIDDDAASRKIVSLFLKDIVDCEMASSAEEAIIMVEQNKFSLILMDISLGKGMSGVDLLKAVRKIKNCDDVPIIAVTAHAMVGDKENFLSVGFDDYLSKPFSKKDLLTKLRQMFEEHHQTY